MIEYSLWASRLSGKYIRDCGNTFLPQFFVSHGDTKDTKTHEGIKMNNILCVLRVPIAIGIVGNHFLPQRFVSHGDTKNAKTQRTRRN